MDILKAFAVQSVILFVAVFTGIAIVFLFM
jgi:hypothetical protein